MAHRVDFDFQLISASEQSRHSCRRGRVAGDGCDCLSRTGTEDNTSGFAGLAVGPCRNLHVLTECGQHPYQFGL